ncbi:hypothetical protein ACVFYP_12825 [Roseomonas sp. F4]
MPRPDRRTFPPSRRRNTRRAILLLALPALAGCQIGPMLAATSGPVLVASGAGLVLTGRTPIDHVASLATGRDCSLVRVERRESWCAPPDPVPVAQPFCTRSLGAVDCWTAPPTGAARPVADPPQPSRSADPLLSSRVAEPPQR